MRVETWLWTGVMVFYLVIGALYTAISDDPVGSSILLIASGFGGLMAGWTWEWGRRHGPRPEDLHEADQIRAGDDGAGKIVNIYMPVSVPNVEIHPRPGYAVDRGTPAGVRVKWSTHAKD